MDIGFDYQISENPVIFDVGGYNGEFTEYISNKYKCGVHIFEPVRSSFIRIVEKFKQNPLIWPYDVALEDRDCDGEIHIRDNSSSMYADGPVEPIRIRDIYKFIQGFKLNKIDILKLNCEGSEFKILNRLIDIGWISNVTNIVVQFHAIFGHSSGELDTLKNNLLKTHNIKFQDAHWSWFVKK